MTGHDWFRDAVVYSVDVKTFYDGDGDGWGDFQGLYDRLPYLDRLGVDCVWLLPFYPSPKRDNGYDVADYYDVDPQLGTLEEFHSFVDAAHERGIRVMADMVLNHTSTEHTWFQRAREDPDSRYRDYYLWTDDPESAFETENFFPDRMNGVWSYDEVADAYYFHQFYSSQPDLNVANPEVRAEMHEILGFWLDQGVDGFRLDAATPMISPKGADGERVEEPFELFRELKATVEAKSEDAVLLAEADDEPEVLEQYFARGEAIDLMLNFQLNAHLVYALETRDDEPIRRALGVLPDGVEQFGQWANFLRNHDELNLGSLPPEMFEDAKARFDDGESWIFERGVRRRLASLLDGDHDRIACAHSLLFSLPGTPVLFSGDEIGMGDDLSLPERDAVRTPFQWADAKNAGFSTADPRNLIRHPIEDGPYGSRRINAAAQLPNADSLFNRIVRLIHARKLCPEVWKGDHEILSVEPDDVVVTRAVQGSTALVTAHNIGDEPREVEVDVEFEDGSATRLVGWADYELDGGTCSLSMAPGDYLWLRGDRRGEVVPLGAP